MSGRKCWSCSHYDANDYIYCFGTCEILDEDLHATSECICPEDEIVLVESLLAERDEKWQRGS